VSEGGHEHGKEYMGMGGGVNGKQTDGSMNKDPTLATTSLAVWCGVVWCGVVWCGVACCGVVRNRSTIGRSRQGQNIVRRVVSVRGGHFPNVRALHSSNPRGFGIGLGLVFGKSSSWCRGLGFGFGLGFKFLRVRVMDKEAFFRATLSLIHPPLSTRLSPSVFLLFRGTLLLLLPNIHTNGLLLLSRPLSTSIHTHTQQQQQQQQQHNHHLRRNGIPLPTTPRPRPTTRTGHPHKSICTMIRLSWARTVVQGKQYKEPLIPTPTFTHFLSRSLSAKVPLFFRL
jgi:hypothetical protein